MQWCIAPPHIFLVLAYACFEYIKLASFVQLTYKLMDLWWIFCVSHFSVCLYHLPLMTLYEIWMTYGPFSVKDTTQHMIIIIKVNILTQRNVRRNLQDKLGTRASGVAQNPFRDLWGCSHFKENIPHSMFHLTLRRVCISTKWIH